MAGEGEGESSLFRTPEIAGGMIYRAVFGGKAPRLSQRFTVYIWEQ